MANPPRDPVPQEIRPGSRGAPAATVSTALVGRHAELARLERWLERALSSNHSTLISLLAPSGFGKTRLISEWLSGARKQHPTLRLFASDRQLMRQHGGDLEDALSEDKIAEDAEERLDAQPLAELLRARFAIPIGREHTPESHERIRSTCEAILGERRVGEMLHFVGRYFGLRYRRSPMLEVFESNPLQESAIGRSVVRRLFELDAAQGPLVLVLDPIDANDHETIAFLSEFAKDPKPVPLVIVAVGDPELGAAAPELVARGSLSMGLAPLSREESGQLFSSLLTQAEEIPAAVVADACDIGGGSPALLEEFVRVLISSGAIDTSGEKWKIDSARVLATELPMTVEEAIHARLGALSAMERRVLADASVIGHVFWIGAIVALIRAEQSADADRRGELQADVADAMDALTQREFLMKMGESTLPGEEEYIFKHNLERRLVRGGVGDEVAQKKCLTVAQSLEARPGERTEDQYELLAELYANAKAERRAASARISAAEKQVARGAFDAARRTYESALGLLDATETLARIDTLGRLATVESTLGNGDRALAHLREMRESAWLIDHRDGLATSFEEQSKIELARGAVGHAVDHARRALTIRRQDGVKRPLARAWAIVGGALSAGNEYEEALAAFDESAELYSALSDQESVIEVLLLSAVANLALGEVDSAESTLERIQTSMGDVIDPAVDAQVEVCRGWVLLRKGASLEAEELFARAIELADSVGQQSTQREIRRIASDAFALGIGGEPVKISPSLRTALEKPIPEERYK